MKSVKQVRADIFSQLKYLWKALLFLYLPIAILFLLTGLLSRLTANVSLGFLLRDVAATADLPFYTGFVSQLGLILWSASLTVCLFALVMLKRQNGNLSASKRFLMHSAILTAILVLDDIFLFHEEIAPLYLHLDELVVFAAYMLVGVGFVSLNWREILTSEYALLLLAFALFAASIALDAVPKEALPEGFFWEQLELFLEDAFKFAGMVTWLLYYARYALQRMAVIQRSRDTASS